MSASRNPTAPRRLSRSGTRCSLSASIPARIYEDLASGRRDDRPGLAACLKAIQPGNTLVLWKLDRLGRDLRHLVNTVEDLRTRGVGLKVLAGPDAIASIRSIMRPGAIIMALQAKKL